MKMAKKRANIHIECEHELRNRLETLKVALGEKLSTVIRECLWEGLPAVEKKAEERQEKLKSGLPLHLL